MNNSTCFSCDKEFELEAHNERDEGDFCDNCLFNHGIELIKSKLENKLNK